MGSCARRFHRSLPLPLPQTVATANCPPHGPRASRRLHVLGHPQSSHSLHSGIFSLHFIIPDIPFTLVTVFCNLQQLCSLNYALCNNIMSTSNSPCPRTTFPLCLSRLRKSSFILVNRSLPMQKTPNPLYLICLITRNIRYAYSLVV